MIKKNISKSDLKDWENYTKNPKDIYDKDLSKQKTLAKKRFKFDLHGYTLENANKKVKEIILFCSDKKYHEILLRTGKGLHSKLEDDVYSSVNMNKLKNSIPDFIKSDEDISKLIQNISQARQEEGGDGALIIKFIK